MRLKRNPYVIVIACLCLMATQRGYAQYVDLLWNRLAHYPIHEGAEDISGNGNHGLVSGASLTADRWGNANHAYFFDGIDDKIICGSNMDPVTTSVAVCCWIRAGTSNDYAHIISKYDYSSDGGFILGIQDGLLKWSGRIGAGQFISMTSITRIDDDQWHHVLGMIDGSTWSVYVDGILEKQFSTGFLQTDLDCTEPLTIGMYFRGDKGDHRFFNGTLDGIIIYNRALNPCEIEVLYSGVGPGAR